MININKIEDIIDAHRITGRNVLSAEAELAIIHFMVDHNWQFVKDAFYDNNLDVHEVALRARLRQGKNPTADAAQAADIAMFSAIAADMIDEFYQIVDHYGVCYFKNRGIGESEENFLADRAERIRDMRSHA